MKRTRLTLILIALLMNVGCEGVKRLTGTSDDKQHKNQFHIVAACMDTHGTAEPTFPTFLPQAQIDLIHQVQSACHYHDCQINGDTWLATGVDCGHGFGYIGDEYYTGRGY